MRTDAPKPATPEEPLGGPPLRPPKRAELLADNRAFVALATDLLNAMRKTADGACAFCGAPAGRQHRRGRICFRLVLWRSKTQYKYKKPE